MQSKNIGFIVLFAAAGLAYADASGAFLYGQVDPPVIWNDGASTFTLQVATTKTGVAAVNYKDDTDTFPLYDDGTHGDLVAGDGIYTCNNLTKTPVPLAFNGLLAIPGVSVEIVMTDGTKQYQIVKLGVVALGMYAPSKQLATNIYVTPAALFVTDPAWGMTSGFSPSENTSSQSQKNFLLTAIQALYSVLPDQFDFVVAMPGRAIVDPTQNYGEGIPFFFLASNTVSNIGQSVFTDPTWGSQRLQGIVYHSFGEGAILTHEFGHRWSAWVGQQLGLSGCPACQGEHWNANSDIGGVMSSYVMDARLPLGEGNLVNNGNGTWRVQSPDILSRNSSYSMMDLYLMGLVSSTDVPPN